MALKIYNTLTAAKEDFVPLEEGRVGMYVCGVTVYDHTHLGHARGAVVFDVVRRYLEYSGYEVKYVRNFTDVDDKIIAKANSAGEEYSQLAGRFINEYNVDMGNLGVRDADLTPLATEHISSMIEMIQALENKGFAYQVGGSVYYSVKKFLSYGKLSKRDPDQLIAGARVEVDQSKKDPLDFALWKESKEGEPAWKSPWGQGRPGWHIECSAMATQHLGETIDIHGGGKDLIFPHHENEIAQSEAATGREFVKYWMHNGFVNIDKEKMSKSTGNFFTVKEILEQYHPEAVRLFLLSTHYRNPIDFNSEALLKVNRGIDRYYSLRREMDAIIDLPDDPKEEVVEVDEEGLDESGKELYQLLRRSPELFREAMDDDFNTARAVGQVFGLVRAINRHLHQREINADPVDRRLISHALQVIGEVGSVLGLFTLSPDAWFKRGLKVESSEGTGDGLDTEFIERCIEERQTARKMRDWDTADSIRQKLEEMGVILEDTSQGTRWQVRN